MQLISLQFLLDLWEIEHDLAPGDNLSAGNITHESAGGLGTNHGRDGLGKQLIQVTCLLDDIRNAFPTTAVRSLVKPGVLTLLGVRILIQPDLVLLNEIYDTAVHIGLAGPKEPLLNGGTEVHDVETAHQGRVQIRQLILVSGINRTYDAATFRKLTAGQLSVQRKVHDGL